MICCRSVSACSLTRRSRCMSGWWSPSANIVTLCRSTAIPPTRKPTRFSMRDGWATTSATAPIRCTLQFITTDGWVPNPKGYTTSNTVHWKMEGIFVAANFKQLQFADLVPAQPQRLTHPFQDYMQYLYDSHKLVETAYQLEKARRLRRRGYAQRRASSFASVWPPDLRCCVTCGTRRGCRAAEDLDEKPPPKPVAAPGTTNP